MAACDVRVATPLRVTVARRLTCSFSMVDGNIRRVCMVADLPTSCQSLTATLKLDTNEVQLSTPAGHIKYLPLPSDVIRRHGNQQLQTSRR